MDDNRLIEVDDLRVHFPLEDKTVKAVDGVSWHIDKGETWRSLANPGREIRDRHVTDALNLTDNMGGRIATGT